MLGCKPANRNTEQHDIFFGIGATIAELIPEIISFWPEANGKIHVDAWREVTRVSGFKINVTERASPAQLPDQKLFFLNLGGYKKNEFDEFHYKMLVIASDKGLAIQQAKQSAFYKHTGFTGATSHVDDKFGVDVDDLHEIKDILSKKYLEKFSISLSEANGLAEDEIHLGYFTLDKLTGYSKPNNSIQ